MIKKFDIAIDGKHPQKEHIFYCNSGEFVHADIAESMQSALKDLLDLVQNTRPDWDNKVIKNARKVLNQSRP